MKKKRAQEISAEQQIAFFKKVFDEKKDWNISAGKWHRLNVKLVFENSYYVFAQSLELYGNKEPKIIKLIIGPEMSHLVLLNLRNNRINSIEGLSDLKCINLRQLLLGDNDIVNIRPLIKMQFPVIETISLYSNRINDIKDLYTLDTPHLTTIILGLNSIANFSPLNKSSWAKLRMLSIENNRRCHSINILLKWPNNCNTEVIC